jgi:hypothetical protein
MVATPAKTSVAETRKHPEVNSRENLKSKSHLIFIGDDYIVCSREYQFWNPNNMLTNPTTVG